MGIIGGRVGVDIDVVLLAQDHVASIVVLEELIVMGVVVLVS